MELIEAIHRAGIFAPGDAARAAAEAAGAAAGGGADAAGAPAAGARGCNVAGEVLVPRTPGALLFRVGAGGAVSVRADAVNLSHVVHTFYAGAGRPTPYQARRLGGSFAADVERLSGAAFASAAPRTSHAHTLALVPHAFRFATGHALDAWAYTAESAAFAAPEGEAPSVAVFFALSPLGVAVTEQRLPLWRFAINIAAIVGGVVAALSILDSLLHALAGAAKKAL